MSQHHKNHLITLLTVVVICGCNRQPEQSPFLTDQTPGESSVPFKPELTPDDQLVHKGTFSPDLATYYFTLSDQNFQQFDTYVITKSGNQWSETRPAFFNSTYSEHGVSFSPDGKTLFFSSTRPTNREGITDTWHIWKSEKVDDQWSVPTFVDIPNLRNKLVSHPTVSEKGMLYFHASNPDYSEMDLFQSEKVNGKYGPAQRVAIELEAPSGKCTPHISPDGSYLLFATIGNQLDLYISFNDGQGNWTKTRKLNDDINQFGQGNPYVTPDHKYLFYTTGENQNTWQVKWVNISSELTK